MTGGRRTAVLAVLIGLGAMWAVAGTRAKIAPSEATVSAPSDGSASLPMGTRVAIAMGDATLYSGGDPRLAPLEESRARLSAAVDGMSRDPAARDAACEARLCEADASGPCRLLLTLSDPQRATCRALIKGGLTALAVALSPARSAFALSELPLTLASGDTRRGVAALTPKASGPIVFHAATVASLDPLSLLQLVGHEVGHRAVWPRELASSASDEKTLDTVGAALAVAAMRGTPPPQPPPPLPPGLDIRQACRLASRGELARTWVAAQLDASGNIFLAERDAVPPTLGAWRSGASRLLAHQAVKRSWLAESAQEILGRAPTPPEMEALVERAQEGDVEDTIVASLLGDPIFLEARRVTPGPTFVAAAFRATAGREPSPQELSAGVAQLARFDRASWSLALLRQVDDVHARLAHRWYRHYLNRAPTEREIAAVAARLRRGTPWTSIVEEIILSDEYRLLQATRWEEPCQERANSATSGSG